MRSLQQQIVCIQCLMSAASEAAHARAKVLVAELQTSIFVFHWYVT